MARGTWRRSGHFGGRPSPHRDQPPSPSGDGDSRDDRAREGRCCLTPVWSTWSPARADSWRVSLRTWPRGHADPCLPPHASRDGPQRQDMFELLHDRGLSWRPSLCHGRAGRAPPGLAGRRAVPRRTSGRKASALSYSLCVKWRGGVFTASACALGESLPLVRQAKRRW